MTYEAERLVRGLHPQFQWSGSHGERLASSYAQVTYPPLR